MKILATIESRSSSSRLPGKNLKQVNGLTTTEIMVNRLKRSKLLDDIVICTTIDKSDDKFCELLKEKNIKFFRGSMNNVLQRVLDGASVFKADIIVELTGDATLLDWNIVDQSIEHFFSENVDYVGTTCIQKYPRGQDVKVFTLKTLQKVNELWGNDLDAQEHVSLPIYRHPEIFKLSPLPLPSFPIGEKIRLTLDYREDLQLIRKVIEELGAFCTFQEICEYLEQNPEIKDINGNLQVSYINDLDRNK